MSDLKSTPPMNLLILPAPGRRRAEASAFIEGCIFLLSHLHSYRSDLPNIEQSIVEEAESRYPAWPK